MWIGEGLESNKSLTTLNLSNWYNIYPIGNNRIGNEGVMIIGNTLETNASLTTLDLCKKYLLDS
jgi:hypothetical protein